MKDAKNFLKQLLSKIVSKDKGDSNEGIQSIRVEGLKRNVTLSDLGGNIDKIRKKVDQLNEDLRAEKSEIDIYQLYVLPKSSIQNLVIGLGNAKLYVKKTLESYLELMSKKNRVNLSENQKAWNTYHVFQAFLYD
jgi:hypothetical protein